MSGLMLLRGKFSLDECISNYICQPNYLPILKIATLFYFQTLTDAHVTNVSIHCTTLTLSPPTILSSAKCLTCFNIQSTSMWLKVGEHVVLVSNSLDPGETSHPDSSCSQMAIYSCLAV